MQIDFHYGTDTSLLVLWYLGGLAVLLAIFALVVWRSKRDSVKRVALAVGVGLMAVGAIGIAPFVQAQQDRAAVTAARADAHNVHALQVAVKARYGATLTSYQTDQLLGKYVYGTIPARSLYGRQLPVPVLIRGQQATVVLQQDETGRWYLLSLARELTPTNS